MINSEVLLEILSDMEPAERQRVLLDEHIYGNAVLMRENDGDIWHRVDPTKVRFDSEGNVDL